VRGRGGRWRFCDDGLWNRFFSSDIYINRYPGAAYWSRGKGVCIYFLNGICISLLVTPGHFHSAIRKKKEKEKILDIITRQT
jgi:hypothetical protein